LIFEEQNAMAATDFFKNPIALPGYNFTPPTGIDYSFPADNFGIAEGDPRNLGSPSSPSPTQPGSESQAGWGKQLAELLGGIGAGIAAARGDMPMAGQLLSGYFQEKTGDRDESSESSLEKALRALKESGMISFKLDTGDQNKLMM
jgi:hypothetical protein